MKIYTSLSDLEKVHFLLFLIEKLETVTSERSKEKEIIRKNLTDNEQKLMSKENIIRELSNMVQELTVKVKDQDAKINVLESASINAQNNHKNDIQNLEQKIREVTTQLGEEQNKAHQLKTENNGMKITINQLTQSLEGQKAAYENLRSQLANVYKEQKMEQMKEQNNMGYVPKVTLNVSNRNSSFTRNQNDIYKSSSLISQGSKAKMK